MRTPIESSYTLLDGAGICGGRHECSDRPGVAKVWAGCEKSKAEAAGGSDMPPARRRSGRDGGDHPAGHARRRLEHLEVVGGPFSVRTAYVDSYIATPAYSPFAFST